MKALIRLCVILICVVVTPSYAVQSIDKTIKELIEVSHIRAMSNGMFEKSDMILKNQLDQTFKDKDLKPNEKKAMERMVARMTALKSSVFSWDNLEPQYIKMYKETFTQEEIQGMLAFYKTPAGQAVIKKMPLLMGKSMQFTNYLNDSFLPQMEAIQHDFIREVQSTN